MILKEGLSQQDEAHLRKIRSHFDSKSTLKAGARSYRTILAQYYNLLIDQGASVLEIGCGGGDLLAALHAEEKWGIDLSEAQINQARAKVPNAQFYVQAGEELNLPDRTFDYIILSDAVNFAADVQLIFEKARRFCHPRTRLLVNSYNTLWRPLIGLATRLGIRASHPESNWLARSDLLGLLQLSGWELVRAESRILCPIPLFGLERSINRYLAPACPGLCLTLFAIARPVGAFPATEGMRVSVVIPARNEAGNIENAVLRSPVMGNGTELIFVEGGSRDDTWNEIQRVKEKFPDRRIKALRQTGKGKGDAVRLGFAEADGDLLMILDADLTVPPEELPKFYQAVASGCCEFANGSRLVYPMEDRAMRFLNLCANKTFGIIFSWVLGQQVKDTLCGTKALTREDYLRLTRNRNFFGEFDPFGDFDLLFGASKLNLKIMDVPVRYCERTYGETNISRWRHGVLLLCMVIFAAKKLKFI
jgi:SAM-dependent methyltransferase